MAVKRLQNKVKKTLSSDGFINAPNTKKARTELKVTLRIPDELLDKVDEFRAKEMVKESRNTWILKAIKRQIDLKIGSI